MSKYLRDIGFYRSPTGDAWPGFGSDTNFLERLYLSGLPKLLTHGVSKIVVQPSENSPSKPFWMLVNPTVWCYTKQFDSASYRQAGPVEKKVTALNFLQECLIGAARINRWSTDPLETAYHQAQVRGLVYEGPWGKLVRGPKNFSAQFWCHYDWDHAKVYICLFHKGILLLQHFLQSVRPGDVWINEITGGIEWCDDITIKVSNSGGTQIWQHSLAV